MCGPLGEVAVDTAPLQLVRVETERRALYIPWDYMEEWGLGRTVRRVEAMRTEVEEQYASSGAADSGKGTGHFRTDRENITSAILELGNQAASMDPPTSPHGGTLPSRRTAASPSRSGTWPMLT